MTVAKHSHSLTVRKDGFKMVESLSHFSGTETYTKAWGGVLLTDGVKFVCDNNASWLISDMCVILKMEDKIRQESFIAIKFKLNDDLKSCVVKYEDGNSNLLYKQSYKYTDFNKHFQETEITFYYTDGVLMLSGEY
jgi:hypothetical protein